MTLKQGISIARVERGAAALSMALSLESSASTLCWEVERVRIASHDESSHLSPMPLNPAEIV
jgi:hypothetical protein